MNLETQQHPGRRRSSWRRLAWAAAGAQVLALCTAGSSSSSQRLADLGVVAPSTQLFLTYALLAAAFAPAALLLRRRERARAAAADSSGGSGGSSSPWRLARYPLLALLDAEANTLVTAAIPVGGASVTSATLLGCLSVPAAMALSSAFLGHRYGARHAAGAAVCVAGLAVLVLADARSGGGGGARAASSAAASPSSSPLWGDLLAAAGAALYAASNVAQERLLADTAPPPEEEQDGGGFDGAAAVEESEAQDQEDSHGITAPPPQPRTEILLPAVELLAALGVYGALVTGAQALLLDRAALSRSFASAAAAPAAAAPAFASFALCLFVFYALLPIVLALGGATLLNVSLLTGNLWAALARLVFFGGFASALELRAFGAAFLLVAGGLALYASAGPLGVVGAGGQRGGEAPRHAYRPVGGDA